MRTRKVEFEVPAALMPKFTEELVSKQLDHQLTGITEDDEIIIEILFNQDDPDEVEELEEFFDDLIENQEEE